MDAMGDGRREAQMLKVERSRDWPREAICFRKSPYMLPMGVNRWIRNDIVCSIFFNNLVQREERGYHARCQALKRCLSATLSERKRYSMSRISFRR